MKRRRGKSDPHVTEAPAPEAPRFEVPTFPDAGRNHSTQLPPPPASGTSYPTAAPSVVVPPPLQQAPSLSRHSPDVQLPPHPNESEAVPLGAGHDVGSFPDAGRAHSTELPPPPAGAITTPLGPPTLPKPEPMQYAASITGHASRQPPPPPATDAAGTPLAAPQIGPGPTDFTAPTDSTWNPHPGRGPIGSSAGAKARRASSEKQQRRQARQRKVAAVVAVVGILGVCAGAVYWFTTSQKTGIAADLHVYAPEHLSALPPVLPESANTVPLGVPPAAVTGTTGFEVIDRQADGAPVAWDPCQPIYYVVNNARAPEGGPELLRGAIDKVAFATGLRFAEAGLTNEDPSTSRKFVVDQYGNRFAPVLIAWVSPNEMPELDDDVLALTGTRQAYTDPAGSATVFVSGFVAFDGPAVAELTAADREAVVLHELGHLVGLDHAEEESELMYPELRGTAALQDGDLAGLAALGRGRCFPNL